MALGVCGLLLSTVGLGSCGGGKGGGNGFPEERPDGAVRLYAPEDPASAQNPAFSPDGRTILFTLFHRGYNAGPAGLYLLALNDGAPVPLLDEVGHDSVNLPGSSWNGTTGRITFASDRQEVDEIWTMAGDGSGLFRVTHHTTPFHFVEPSFSPDGQWIVLEADPEGSEEEPQGSIWKVRSDGTGLTPLTDGPGSGYDDRQPNWSPAGDRILFQRRRAGSDDWNLYLMAADGTDLHPLTTAPSSDTDASWSPDGRWIVYSTDHGGLAVPNIFVISVEGGNPLRITYDDTHEDGAPSWSPDGRWIAFESHEGSAEDTPAALWRIAAPSLVGPPSWESVNDFAYQLQDVNLTEMGNSRFDLIIMDYSRDGSAAGRFTASQIQALKNSPGGPKWVLAYLSIGEAENYRWYWDKGWDANNDGTPDPGAPAWLGPANPDWPGNYKVKYWQTGWQSILYGSPTSYLDQIMAAGFDGVYLDIIDAYEYWGPGGESGLNRSTAEQEMVELVKGIANYARITKGRPYFGIFPQNGEALAVHADYVQVVTGIGKEDTWYDGNTPQPSAYTDEVIANLDLFKQAGKLVLVIDYVTRQDLIDGFYARAKARGYVPYATVRDLDRLTIYPGHEPD